MSEREPSTEENGNPLVLETPKIGPSILIIDGNFEYTDMLKQMITSYIAVSKFHVASAGQEGIDKFLENGGYDIVITGRVKVNGERVACEVKKAKPDTVVWMITADDEFRRDSKDIDLLLRKPFWLNDFEKMFKEATKLVEIKRSTP